MPAKKFRSIVIDTVNQLQADQMMQQEKKVDFDGWFDYGKDIYTTLSYGKKLDSRDLVSILILGKEGTGKTVGVKDLNPEETYYVNADKKPMSFPGWRKIYKPGRIADGANYNDEIDNYDDLKELISVVYENKADGPFFIFYMGHVEDYKTTNGAVAQKFKTLGKVATKQNIEGAVTHAYYTDIDTAKKMDDVSRYRFRVVNSGYDTARSPMSYWNTIYIPNNLQMIVDKVLEMEY